MSLSYKAHNDGQRYAVPFMPADPPGITIFSSTENPPPAQPFSPISVYRSER
jgi:hypothetical protein